MKSTLSLTSEVICTRQPYFQTLFVSRFFAFSERSAIRVEFPQLMKSCSISSHLMTYLAVGLMASGTGLLSSGTSHGFTSGFIWFFSNFGALALASFFDRLEEFKGQFNVGEE